MARGTTRAPRGRKDTPPGGPGEPSQGPIEPAGPLESVVLVARRGRVRGRISFEHNGLYPLRLRSVPLRGVQLLEPGGSPVSILRTFARVAPGQRIDVPVSLQLHPNTLAGTYPATVQLGDRSIPVLIVVPEEPLVRITPPILEVETRAGAEIERQITIENLGNVMVHLRDPEPVVLEQWDRLHAMVRDAVRATEAEDYEVFLNRLVGRAKEMVAGDRERLIVPHLSENTLELPPGQTAVVTLHWKMPRQLERGQSFRARLRIAGVPLVLEVRRPRERPLPDLTG